MLPFPMEKSENTEDNVQCSQQVHYKGYFIPSDMFGSPALRNVFVRGIAPSGDVWVGCIHEQTSRHTELFILYL